MTENNFLKEKQAILKSMPDTICFTREHAELMVNALEEVQKYLAIGTVEQCREAVERMKPKRPKEYEDKFYGCPNCKNPLMHKWEKYPKKLTPRSQGLAYCLNCGQAIDWSDTPEKENT